MSGKENYNNKVNDYDHKYTNMDIEKNSKVQNDWDINKKNGFIRNVYGIVTIQLLTTTIFILLSIFFEGYATFVRESYWPLVLGVTGMFVFPIFTIFGRGYLRMYPLNYLLLFFYTLSISYIVSYMCSTYDVNTVLTAFGITLAITVFLTIFTCIFSIELHALKGLGLYITQGIVVGIFFLLWLCYNFSFFQSLIMCLTIAVFSFYLIYDIKLIIDNGKKHEVDPLQPNDYVLGSFLIYTDIIMIFLEILELISLICQSED